MEAREVSGDVTSGQYRAAVRSMGSQGRRKLSNNRGGARARAAKDDVTFATIGAAT